MSKTAMVIDKENLTDDIMFVYKHVSMALTQAARLNYKIRPYVEPREINAIKQNLINFNATDNKVKDMLVDYLSDFEKNITKGHAEKIKDVTHKKLFCESQARMFELQKNKLIMERLSRIEWPYDEKTKAFDAKIAYYEAQAKSFDAKVVDLSSRRPAADEKDLLKFQLATKEQLKGMVACS